MENVYVVWFDNNSKYEEDHDAYIQAIFKTAKEAKKYIKNEGFPRKVRYESYIINTDEYKIVDNTVYYLPESEASYWDYNPSLEIREYTLQG